MKFQSIPVVEAVSYLNDKQNGFWIPNIQCPFVWKEEQICNLFDSILRNYPISTLLIWVTKQKIKCRRFVNNYKSSERTKIDWANENAEKKGIVLDGQQRLQSLKIGLDGSYDEKELFLDFSYFWEPDKHSDCRFVFTNPNDKRNNVLPRVRFREVIQAKNPQFGTWDSTYASKPILAKVEEIGKTMATEWANHCLHNLVSTIQETFVKQHVIGYHELIGEDYTQRQDSNKVEHYTIDNVVDIFIRVNSGGTKLGKSDLLFSLINADWKDVTDNMEQLLTDINQHGYEFDQDFILKSCLTLLTDQAVYNHKKLDKKVRQEIQNNWKKICSAIKDVIDFLYEKTLVRNSKTLPSPNALIPIIYLRYHYKKESLQRHEKDIWEFLIRTLLSGAFSSNVDYLINDLVKQINKQDGKFMLTTMLVSVTKTGHSPGVYEENLSKMGYGHKNNLLLFSFLYDINLESVSSSNKLQVDHIFPQSLLEKETVKDSETDTYIPKYKKENINNLANCMLVKAEINQKKGDQEPSKWLAKQTSDFLERHLIPNTPELWEIERFTDFIKAREEKIKEKLANILVQTVAQEKNEKE
jgi:hypothetical protein